MLQPEIRLNYLKLCTNHISNILFFLVQSSYSFMVIDSWDNGVDLPLTISAHVIRMWLLQTLYTISCCLLLLLLVPFPYSLIFDFHHHHTISSCFDAYTCLRLFKHIPTTWQLFWIKKRLNWNKLKYLSKIALQLPNGHVAKVHNLLIK